MCYCCTFPCRLVSSLSEEGGVSGSAEKAGEGRGRVGGKEGAEQGIYYCNTCLDSAVLHVRQATCGLECHMVVCRSAITGCVT